jgi:hypothetical protein
MERDGRSFDRRTLETIRLIAIESVRVGERPSSVVASYGSCCTTTLRCVASTAAILYGKKPVLGPIWAWIGGSLRPSAIHRVLSWRA